MRMMPLVSIVVLNFNGLAYLETGLEECLNSVLETGYPNFEVIFVDNGSTDKSVDFVSQRFKFRVRLVKSKCNLGFSEGFNMGIRASKGKYIALLSNDMTVDRDWLNSIVSLMESDTQVSLAGFKRLRHGKTDILDGIGGNLTICGRVKPIGFAERDRGQYDTNIDDLDFIGGAMVVRRKTFEKVGLFDPDFIIFSEDVDLCFRIRKAGYKVVYVPDAVIWHKGQATLSKMDPIGVHMEYMASRSRIQFFLIHFTLRRVLATLLIDFIWFVLTNSTSKILLLKAYLWNVSQIGKTLQKRARYGPSPPYRCKAPVTPFFFSDFRKRLSEILAISGRF